MTKPVCGVPQGSVLDLAQFHLFTTDLLRLLHPHGLDSHLNADDTQIYGFCSSRLQSRVSDCIGDLDEWMRSNRQQLNADKAEMIWFTSPRRQHQIPSTRSWSEIGRAHV